MVLNGLLILTEIGKNLKLNKNIMNSPTLKELEEQLSEIEKECDKSEMDWQFKQALMEYRGEDEVIQFKDFKLDKQSKHHIPSGIKDLDSIIGGFGKGDIILLTGDTGDGKSTFSRFLIRKLSETGKKSLVFSYEESNSEFLEKFCGNIPDGCLPKVLNEKSLVWIERKIIEAIVKFDVECVFIDNLKGMIDYGNSKNLTNEIDAIMQGLKAIAMKYNIVIFLLAHIKKEEGKMIDKNSVKDSKTIVDTSSIALALCRIKEKRQKYQEDEPLKYTNYTLFYLIKNRYNGKYENFTMLYHPLTGNYTEKPQDSIISQDKINEDYEKL